MNRKDFYDIVKEEKLDNYNIGDSQEATMMANIMGYVHNDVWIVYETDERGSFRSISEHDSEEDALDALLIELRNKKRKEEIFKKLHRK